MQIPFGKSAKASTEEARFTRMFEKILTAEDETAIKSELHSIVAVHGLPAFAKPEDSQKTLDALVSATKKQPAHVQAEVLKGHEVIQSLVTRGHAQDVWEMLESMPKDLAADILSSSGNRVEALFYTRQDNPNAKSRFANLLGTFEPQAQQQIMNSYSLRGRQFAVATSPEPTGTN